MLYSFTNFTIKDNCMRDYLADTLDQTRKGSIWSLGLKFYPAFMPVYRQWRSQDFVMGGFSAGTPGNWGRTRGRVREGVYPLLPGVRGLVPRENFSDCRCIFVIFSALF
jgi:hypothetical protein